MSKLIYIDTEFTSFSKPELISMGAVTYTGESFYVEITNYNRHKESDFVKSVVLPLLNPNTYGKKKSGASVSFYHWLSELGEAKFVCDFSDDFSLICDLLNKEFPLNIELNWIHVNDLLVSAKKVQNNGTISDRERGILTRDYFEGIDFYLNQLHLHKHHALNDAMAMKFSVERILDNMSY